MPTFQRAEDYYELLGGFLDDVTKSPDLGPKFVAANTSFLVTTTDPVARILVDCTTDPPVVVNDPPEETAGEITLLMTSDDAHKFWQGKLNVTIAMARKQVKAKGPLSKLMKLLPAIQPAFPRYRSYLEARGHADKVV